MTVPVPTRGRQAGLSPSGANSQPPNRPTPLRIHAFVKYGRTAASTRQRVLQFVPHLQRSGVDVDVHYLLDDDYVRSLATGAKSSRLRVGWSYLRRMARLRFGRGADILWIYAESFPYLPAMFERLAIRRGTPIIYDFDDAFFHQYDSSPNPLVRTLLGGKLRPLLATAAACTCGNQYLKDYADQLCDRTVLLPTVVDTDVYRPAPKLVHKDRSIVIGWIGSPSTWPYVRPMLGLLAELCRDHPVKMNVIGAGVKAEADAFPGLELIEWGEDTEVRDVQRMDIGIMPLPDDGWARGKSGYKLIQYMACGLPVVASPVGANNDIVEDGVSGLLAGDLEEWRAALIRLVTDADLRDQLGREARRRVEEKFSTTNNAKTLIALVHDIAGQGR